MTTNWNPFSEWNQLKRNHKFSYFWIKADWNTIPKLFVCNLVLTIFRLIRNSCCWINYCCIPKYNSQVKTACLIETMWVFALSLSRPNLTWAHFILPAKRRCTQKNVQFVSEWSNSQYWVPQVSNSKFNVQKKSEGNNKLYTTGKLGECLGK